MKMAMGIATGTAQRQYSRLIRIASPSDDEPQASRMPTAKTSDMTPYALRLVVIDLDCSDFMRFLFSGAHASDRKIVSSRVL